MPSVFFSYSHADETLRNELEKHLSQLKREGSISTWHDRRILPGDRFDGEISKWLEAADIILLLVSSDFLASDYCYGVELGRAMDREAKGEARVIPVILRPCDWHTAPFGKLLALPKDGKPVTKWPSGDDAFLDVTKGIRAAVASVAQSTSTAAPIAAAVTVHRGQRSSNLRTRKTFTERDRDAFLDESFEYIAHFFENSLSELQVRNPGIEGTYKRIDAARFTATVYRDGKTLTRCTIKNGGEGRGPFGGISLSHGIHASDSSINESLSVDAGDQSLFLKSMGMAMRRAHDGDGKLSQEGAAEYYWAIFIEPLQR